MSTQDQGLNGVDGEIGWDFGGASHKKGCIRKSIRGGSWNLLVFVDRFDEGERKVNVCERVCNI